MYGVNMEIKFISIGIAKNKYSEKYNNWKDAVTIIYIYEKY
jgi:hypothetical protein